MSLRMTPLYIVVANLDLSMRPASVQIDVDLVGIVIFKFSYIDAFDYVVCNVVTLNAIFNYFWTVQSPEIRNHLLST